MKNNFTDFVRESVISKWLNLQINTPKKYLLNFNIDDLKYQLYYEIERPVLEVYYEYFNEYRQKEHLAETSNKLNLFKEYISTSDFQKDLVNSFPELISYIKLREEFFNRYINKLLKDLDTWWKDYNFKSLDRINCFNGDSHNQGQHVCQIIVDTDKSFYYKPRSSQVEKRFNELLADFMDIENFVVYSKEDFSIQKEIQRISPSSENDIKKYYYNLGIISAIFYLFNSSDMHYENMIIHKDQPYFFDLETITTINHNYLASEINSFKNFMNNSIVGSNIFPAPILSNNIDISVLTGVDWKEEDNLNYEINVKNDNNDNIEIVKTKSILEDGKNEIIINGEKINPILYVENIVEGFSHTSDKIIKNKDEFLDKMISVIKGQKIRQILRPTNTYAKFLNSSLDPYYLQSQANRNSILRILGKGMYKSCKNLIECESHNLSQGDIPLFYSDFDSLNLYDDYGNILEKDFFSISCEQMLKNKFSNFSKKDIDKQISLMKASIYVACFNKYERIDFPDLTVKKNGRVKDICHQVCLDYYDSFSQENEYLFNTNVIGNGEKLALWLTDFSLYESGGLLLLSYLREDLDLPDDFFEQITKTVYSLNTQLDRSLNAYNGIGSELYFLYTFYCQEQLTFYRKNIIKTLDEIDKKSLEEIKEFDYFNGISGVLAVLSNTYESLIIKKKKDEELIAKVFDLILSFQKIFLDNKKLIKEKYKAGLAHGFAGIYYSLGLSYQINEDSNIKDMCEELIDLEEKYYLEDYNDYLDPRDQTVGHFYLCYGIVGILLARIELYKIGFLEKSTIINKLDKLIDQLKIGLDFSSMTYSLCHGIASLIELMISVKSIDYRKEDCREIIDILIKEELKNSRNGYGDKIDIDSFMNGKLGKLCGIVRTYEPWIPSFTLLKYDVE